MNRAILVGRLTKDPENRQTPNGVSVTTFTIAIPHKEDRDKTEFINIVTWRGLADTCAKYLTKGERVGVVGEIRTRNYEAKDGSKRYITEVQADDVEFYDKQNKKEEHKEQIEDDLIEVDDGELPF